ncbi:MAG TPA: hypothetical protein DHV48_11970, partial [Prolixibacteraceae bacterium]|nr:hypothetical protein [Prolixibacteraceae bacterium]
MKTQNLLHFKIPANTAILPSSENLFSKTSEEMRFRAQQFIVKTKRMLKLLALFMIFLLSGAGVMATNYYTNTSGDPRILNNWWTGTNGTGTHPESFTNQADVFIIQNNHTMTASNTWSVSNLAINAGGALNLTGSQTLFLYGNFTNHGAFSTTTIVLTGNANQSIDGFATYGRIAMSKSGGTATFQGNVNGGILDINGAGGTLNLGAGLTHTFTGSWNNTQGTLNGGSSLLRIEGSVENSGSVFIGGTGTVEWSGWNNQTVAGVTYNNLIISGSATKTLAGNTNVAGILTVKAGTTLALGSYTLGASTPPASIILECGASVGSVIYGSSGTLYLGGDVTVNSEGTGNNGSTISCPVALGAPRIFSVANDGTSATDLTVSGVISGAFPLTKVGEGKLILTANNGFSGGLNISAGMVELGAADVIATQMMTLNGGTFSSGAATGYNETLGSLALTNNSTIQVGIGNHSLHFAASNGVSWTSGKTLNITGWAGSPGSSGTGGKIYFGTSTGTLTAAQLSQITFVGYPGTPFLLSTGELVPYVATPVITVGSISGFGNQCINTASDIQFYTVSGSSLTDPIEITPPSGFEISANGGSLFSSTSTLRLNPSNGALSDIPIYVRFVPTIAQAYSGNLTHTSTGATSVNVAVTGDGKDRPSIATNPNPADGISGVTYEGSGAVSSVSWSAVSGATSYEVYFGAGVLPGSPTATNVVTNSYSTGALSGGTTYHWKVVPKNDCGATTGIPVEWTFTTGSSPIITVSATSLAFGEVCVNSSSPDQSYTISGTSLTGPIEITSPSGFEISTGTGAGFVSTNPINLTPTDGTVSATNIYVRFAPTAAQAYSGNITHTSTGATSVNVAVTGDGNPLTVAGSVSGGTTICTGSTSGLLSLGAHTGNVVRWESSLNGTDWTPIANIADSYTSGALTATTQFRAVVQSGECDAANSLATTVTVEETPVAGTLAKNPNLNIVCEGTSVNAILTPGSGGNSTDQLEYQTKTGATWTDWTAYTSGADISTSGKTDVQIRTRRMADVCSPSEYNTVSWAVEATPVTGILAKTPNVETVCEGSGVSARIVGGSGGGTYSWELIHYRTLIGSSWSEWDTYTPDEVIFTTGMSGVEMRAKRLGNVCPSFDWVYASWTVVAQPVAGAIIKTPDLETICEGTTVLATFAEGSGGVSCTDTYGYRYDGIGDWIEYTPATTLSTTGHTLVEIRTQRDGCQDHCNTDTRTVNWAVGDDQVPTISCPGVLIVNVDPGSCQYMVKGTEFDPTYSDNCGVTEAWNSVTGAAFSLKDELFSIGEHTV